MNNATQQNLADLAKVASDALAAEAEKHKVLADAATQYLGAISPVDPTVKKLTATMRVLQDQTKKTHKPMSAILEALGSVQKSALTASATLAASGAALRQLASAAQPGLFNSLDGAVKILTAELGSALLPTMLDVTDQVLLLAEWFESLDDGTKKLIAGGALSVPMIVGLGHTLRALAPALDLATRSTKNLAKAAGEMALAERASLAAGRSAVIGIASLAAWLFSGNGRAPADTRAGAVTQGQLQSATSPERFGFFNSGDALTGRPSQEQVRQAREEVRHYRQRAEEIRGSWWRPNRLAEASERMAQVYERYAESGVRSPQAENDEAKHGRLESRARHLNMQLAEAERGQQPHYSALAEARKSMQLQILGKGPFEQRLLDIQRKNIPVIRKTLEETLRQLEELNRRSARSG